MSRNILEDFYYGNFIPADRQVIHIPEVTRAEVALADAGKRLRDILPPEGIPLMEQYQKANAAFNVFTDAENYIDGFKSGARFMIEILDNSYKNFKPTV